MKALLRFIVCLIERLIGPTHSERDEESLDLVEQRFCEALRTESRSLDSYTTNYIDTIADDGTDSERVRALRMEQAVYQRTLAESYAAIRAARRP